MNNRYNWRRKHTEKGILMVYEEGKLLEMVMELIMHGGDAKSSALEAIQSAKKGEFDEATNLLADSEDAIERAHKSQTKLLTKEASGDTIELSLLMIHGQDHLMNAITTKDLALEIIDVYRKLDGQDILEEL